MSKLRIAGSAVAIILAALTLTGCYDAEQALRDKAKIVQACKNSGGEWYNTPGWGEACNFDTRSTK